MGESRGEKAHVGQLDPAGAWSLYAARGSARARPVAYLGAEC